MGELDSEMIESLSGLWLLPYAAGMRPFRRAGQAGQGDEAATEPRGAAVSGRPTKNQIRRSITYCE